MKKPFATVEGNEVILAPGQLYFGEAPTVVHTLLGSCVAVTFWHPQHRVGGMCHYLLAHRQDYPKTEHHPHGYYGSDAVAYFVRQLDLCGLQPPSLEVKLFGGGNMFSALYAGTSPIDVASNNVTEGRRLLEAEGFCIKTEDVGGVRYRKIFFDLSTGDVWVQYGKHSKNGFME